jgi:hypothetical protein
MRTCDEHELKEMRRGIKLVEVYGDIDDIFDVKSTRLYFK